MKKRIIIFCFCSFFQFSFAQKSSSGMCKVDVEDITNVASFGYLIGYTVKFKNNSKSTVDGIWWTSYYYDNSGDLMKYESDSFNSSGIIKPIASGSNKSIVRSPRVKGASKVVVKITKTHFSDGKTCK